MSNVRRRKKAHRVSGPSEFPHRPNASRRLVAEGIKDVRKTPQNARYKLQQPKRRQWQPVRVQLKQVPAARPASGRSADRRASSSRPAQRQVLRTKATIVHTEPVNTKTDAPPVKSGAIFRRHGASPPAMPNPSIERTRTGRPRYTGCLFYVPRGPPVRAAHVKR